MLPRKAREFMPKDIVLAPYNGHRVTNDIVTQSGYGMDITPSGIVSQCNIVILCMVLYY